MGIAHEVVGAHVLEKEEVPAPKRIIMPIDNLKE